MSARPNARGRARVTALAAVVVLAAAALSPAAADTTAEEELRAAVDASRADFDDGEANGAILARADEFADARAGSPLADAIDGPLLLTHPDELADDTAAELRRAVRDGATVHLLGGEAALSPAVAQAVGGLGFDVERHGGATRFDTAEEIAHAVASLREFAIERVDDRGHPDEVVVQVTRPPGLADTDLPPSAWSLTEDGEERPVELADSGAEALQVVLALDVGEDTDPETLDAAREATIGFVNQMPAGAGVGVAGGGASRGAGLVQPPTDDHAAVLATLEDLEPGGRAGLHDVVDRSLAALTDAEVPAVVVLSDGADSAADFDDTLEIVEDSGVTVHVVELVTDDGDPEALRALADAGGGRQVPAGDPAALGPLYDDLAYDLVGPQRLAYASEAGGETELTVTVDHDGVREQATTTVELPAQPGVMAAPSFWASDTGLLVGAGLFYLAMAISILALLAPRQPSSQLAAARARQQRVQGERTPLAGLADRLVGAAEESLRRHGRRGAINAALERAGIALRPGEIVVLTACGAAVAFAVGLVLVAWWMGAALAALVLLAAKAAVSYKARRRQQRFIDQLSDTLQLLAGALRSGYGLQQALDSAAKEAEAPTSEELGRVIVETRLGRDLMDSLRAMADRMGSEDFAWIVQAIDIQREVGGDLAEVLDNVSATVRERARIRRQVKALSAEGRLSALVLFGLPFVVGGFILWTNPGYLATLIEHVMGWAMLGIGAGLLLAGGIWLRNLVDLEY